MPASVTADHLRQQFVFFVNGAITDALREAMRLRVEQVAASRKWIIGPPRFMSTREGVEGLSPGDTPVETLGGLLEIYSAATPWSLAREVDLEHFGEVNDIVSAMREFSSTHNVRIEFELDGVFVGSIVDGQMDRALAEGLLGEWQKTLGL